MTITLASLANGSGRQSTLVTNASPAYRHALITVKLKSNGTPTAGTVYEIYLIRGDGSGNNSDQAGSSDAALTVKNAKLIGTLVNTGSASEIVLDSFDTAVAGSLGPVWGIAIKNSSGQSLTATGGDHFVEYQYVADQIQ